jgi:hypothetical protein
VHGGWVFTVELGGLGEQGGDLGLCGSEDDASLPLALGLGPAGHCVFQLGGDAHVSDLDRLHRDPPGVGLLVEDSRELLAELLALRDHLGKIVTADRLAQRGLRGEEDRVEIRLDLEHRLLGVPHQPENDRVHVDGYGVSREGGFGGHVGGPHALVHQVRDHVHHRDDPEQTRALEAAKLSEAQDHRFLPLVHHLDREHQTETE